MLVPQEIAFNISSKSTTCLQDHQTDPDIPTDAGHRDKTKGSVEFIPCCTAGAEKLAEGLGDRSLERTEQAAERAAGPGLAVDQQRGMWRGRERTKGEAERQKWGKGRNSMLIIGGISHGPQGHRAAWPPSLG